MTGKGICRVLRPLDLVLVSWECSLCKNLLNCMLIICTLFSTYYTSTKKIYFKKPTNLIMPSSYWTSVLGLKVSTSATLQRYNFTLTVRLQLQKNHSPFLHIFNFLKCTVNLPTSGPGHMLVPLPGGLFTCTFPVNYHPPFRFQLKLTFVGRLPWPLA